MILLPITRALSASTGERKVGNIEDRMKYASNHMFVPEEDEDGKEEEEGGDLQPTKNSLKLSWSSPCSTHLGCERE